MPDPTDRTPATANDLRKAANELRADRTKASGHARGCWMQAGGPCDCSVSSHDCLAKNRRRADRLEALAALLPVQQRVITAAVEWWRLDQATMQGGPTTDLWTAVTELMEAVRAYAAALSGQPDNPTEEQP